MSKNTILASLSPFPILVLLIWLISAVIQDLKRFEIEDSLNMSLFFLGLLFYFIRLTEQQQRISFDLLILSIFFLISIVLLSLFLFHINFFGGGDAKLLIALGSFFLSSDIIFSFISFTYFFCIFSISGLIYVIIYLSILKQLKGKKALKKLKIPFAPPFLISIIILISLDITNILKTLSRL